VDVHVHIRTRQSPELFPRPDHFLLNFTPYLQVPGLRIERRDRTIVKYGKFPGQRLSRREASGFLEGLLFFASIENITQHLEPLLVARIVTTL
jgi:hypothetical protein